LELPLSEQREGRRDRAIQFPRILSGRKKGRENLKEREKPDTLSLLLFGNGGKRKRIFQGKKGRFSLFPPSLISSKEREKGEKGAASISSSMPAFSSRGRRKKRKEGKGGIGREEKEGKDARSNNAYYHRIGEEGGGGLRRKARPPHLELLARYPWKGKERGSGCSVEELSLSSVIPRARRKKRKKEKRELGRKGKRPMTSLFRYAKGQERRKRGGGERPRQREGGGGGHAPPLGLLQGRCRSHQGHRRGRRGEKKRNHREKKGGEREKGMTLLRGAAFISTSRWSTATRQWGGEGGERKREGLKRRRKGETPDRGGGGVGPATPAFSLSRPSSSESSSAIGLKERGERGKRL